MSLKQYLKNTFLYNTCRIIFYKNGLRKRRNESVKIALKWRDLNRHNFTYVANSADDNPFPISLVKVGNYCYGPLHVISYGSHDESLQIGNFCSIANGVIFLLGGEHKLSTISTFPFQRIFVDNNKVETFSKGPIVLEDDVWVGTNAMILSGVKLAQGTVVAAGSIVTKSTEPYSIVGGNPARIIKKRFSDEIIQKLLTVNIADFDPMYIRNNIDLLSKQIDASTVQDYFN
jgi:acetyltransferase-like isoleucine patch superfamily enzyme